MKEHIAEVIGSIKTSIVGMGLMTASGIASMLSGEREVRTAMLYIGLIIGIITMIKLTLEVFVTWVRFRKYVDQEKKKHHHEKSH
jgi:hypothetical protein